LIVVLIFFILMFLNVPIAISLGVSSIIYVLFLSVIPASMLIQAFVMGLDSFTLLGVPFFILAGDIMIQGGISRRLLKLSTAIVGGIVGSMAMITVLTSLIFGSISGSGPATVASVGRIAIPAMVQEKYERGFACSIAAASGAFGPLLPPSIVMIMFGVIAGQSISDLFLAGIVPGFLVAISLMIFSFFMARKHKFGAKMNPEIAEIQPEKIKLWPAFKDAIWGILCPLIILGGIYSGAFTPTEAAVVACVYGLIVGIFVYKEIKIKDIPRIFKSAVATNGTILILVSCATAFGRVLTIERVPDAIAVAIAGVSDNMIIILLLITVLVLGLGLFLETLSALIILTPILMPVAVSVGVNPIHFGIMMTMNLAIGQSTPPTGVNLFVAARIGECKIEEILKWLLSPILVLIFVLLLITFIPAISLTLPRIFGNM